MERLYLRHSRLPWQRPPGYSVTGPPCVHSIKATDGPNWITDTNWLNPPEELVNFTAEQLDAWYGVSVSGDWISSVELPVNNLQGILPSALVICPICDDCSFSRMCS